jgi:hypothetical protein
LQDMNSIENGRFNCIATGILTVTHFLYIYENSKS